MGKYWKKIKVTTLLQQYRYPPTTSRRANRSSTPATPLETLHGSSEALLSGRLQQARTSGRFTVAGAPCCTGVATKPAWEGVLAGGGGRRSTVFEQACSSMFFFFFQQKVVRVVYRVYSFFNPLYFFLWYDMIGNSFYQKKKMVVGVVIIEITVLLYINM